MKLIIASGNLKKIREMRDILETLGFEVLSQGEAGVYVEPEETGTTFSENALIKARAVMRACGCAAVADDSGIVVDALDGAPGIYSARFGGDACKSDEDRTNLLLEKMTGQTNRRARFVSSIACVFPNGETVKAEADWEGEIAHAPSGDGGFGYDPVFFVPTEGVSSAELDAHYKNKISHRGKALRIFRKEMERYNADR